MPTVTDWLMVAITIVYVIATIAICIANFKSARASKEQIAEMKHQFDEGNRPKIEVEVICLQRSIFALRFVNNGRSTAQHVTISFKESFINSLGNDKFSQLLEKQKGRECLIGVGQHMDLFIGDNDYWKNKKEPAVGVINYQSGENRYSEDFYVDLENYMVLLATESDEEKLRKQISNITTELKNIKHEIEKIKKGV